MDSPESDTVALAASGPCPVRRTRQTGADRRLPGIGKIMSSEVEWLNQMFATPERELAALPEWARPVLTPPAAAAPHPSDDAPTTATPPQD